MLAGDEHPLRRVGIATFVAALGCGPSVHATSDAGGSGESSGGESGTDVVCQERATEEPWCYRVYELGLGDTEHAIDLDVGLGARGLAVFHGGEVLTEGALTSLVTLDGQGVPTVSRGADVDRYSADFSSHYARAVRVTGAEADDVLVLGDQHVSDDGVRGHQVTLMVVGDGTLAVAWSDLVALPDGRCATAFEPAILLDPDGTPALARHDVACDEELSAPVLRLWRRSSEGVWEASAETLVLPLPFDEGLPRVGDLDGDGEEDLLVRYHAPGADEYTLLSLIRDSSQEGGFALSVAGWPYEMDDSTGVELVDLDHDGVLDVMAYDRFVDVVEGETARVAVYRGRGDGAFDQPEVREHAASLPWLAHGRIDESGERVLLIEVDGEDPLRTTSVVDGLSPDDNPLPFYVSPVAWYRPAAGADVNADGLTDMILSKGSDDRLLLSATP